MKRPITVTLLHCIFFFSAITLPAQSPCDELPLPQEQVTLQLDRNICLAGETIWFKAWCFLDGQVEQEMSQVLYVEIFDETQKAIVQEKYLLANNRTSGAIQIPEDAPSKYYFLKAYTSYMRNFSSSYFHYQQLIIANPLIEKGRMQVKTTTVSKNQSPTPRPSSVSPPVAKHPLQIALNKERYQTRQVIDFQINSPQALTAELSTTVRLQGLGNRPTPQVMRQNKWLSASCQEDPFCQQFYPAENLPNSQAQKKAPSLKTKHLQWLPETRGLTISGVVQNDKQEPVAGALTMLSVPQQSPMLYLGTTDEKGVFTIGLQDMEQQKSLFVGTPNDQHKVLIRNDFNSDLPTITTVPLQFDSTLHHLLTALNLHQQLDQTYPKPKTEAVFQKDQLNIATTNILAPDRRTVLADFIKVPTMAEVFREITPGVMIRKKEGVESLSVFDFKQEKWYDNPLVLLDNVPVFNITELLKIDPAAIEAVEIYQSDYILGDYTIGGMISIISNTDNFADYQWGKQAAFTTFKTFATPTVFKQVIQLEKNHYPNFRPVLYWQPNLQLKQQQSSETISIVAPDRPGIYEVLVQGYTESGEACFGYRTFEVVQSL